jgi:hypothetical protein
LERGEGEEARFERLGMATGRSEMIIIINWTAEAISCA